MLPERNSNQGWWSTRLMWWQGNIKRGGLGKPAALMEHISPNINLLQSSSASAFSCPFSHYSLRIPLPAKPLSMKSPSFADPMAVEGWSKKNTYNNLSSTWALCLMTSGLGSYKNHTIGCTCCIFHGQQLIYVFLPEVSQKLWNLRNTRCTKTIQYRDSAFTYFPFSTSPVSRYSTAASSFPSILDFQRFSLCCGGFF